MNSLPNNPNPKKEGPEEQAPGEQDGALMLRFGRGDLAAFEELYRRNEGRVWRFIRRSVGSSETADEIFQDTWLRAIAQAARFQPLARFSTWIFTIARHRVIDAARAGRPLAAIEPDELEAGQGSDPAAAAVQAESGRALLRALSALPAEQREAFLLQAEGGLAVAEIAVATDVPFETAKSRLKHARIALRAALGEHA